MPRRVCLDIGCGTGATTAWLAALRPGDRRGPVGRDAPARARRPRRRGADAAALPIPDVSIDVAVLMNAFLFADELDRVLAPDGVVVWASAIGADTPIYLPADDVAAALPGAWSGVWAEAGDGTWAVLRRDT